MIQPSLETNQISHKSAAPMGTKKLSIRKDLQSKLDPREVAKFARPNKELVNLENASLNIDNASDVIIGPVTQYNVNGNLTIVQNEQEDAESIEDKDGNKRKFAKKSRIGLNILKDLTPQKKNLCLVLIFFSALLSSIFLLISMLFTKNDVLDPPAEEQPVRKQIITRQEWGGMDPTVVTPVSSPLDVVVIKHTMQGFCIQTSKCKENTKIMQDLSFQNGYSDIMFNFLIGGDGNIYVGRGWGVKNSQNNSTVDIALHGNFCYDVYYSFMINATRFIIDEGVRLNYIAKDYIVVCHNQTDRSVGSVPHICQEVSTWEHYDGGIFL